MEIINDSKNWDIISQGYAHFIGPIFENFMDSYSGCLKLTNSMNVLDLACGPGTASLRIYDKVGAILKTLLTPPCSVELCANVWII